MVSGGWDRSTQTMRPAKLGVGTFFWFLGSWFIKFKNLRHKFIQIQIYNQEIVHTFQGK